MKEENVSLDKKVVSGVGWKIAERVLVQGISFFVTIILARILTPNDYGMVAIVNIFVAFADILLQSGFIVALIQKDKISNEDYSTVFYLNLLLSIGLYVVLFFVAPLISNMYDMPGLTAIIRVIALKLPLSALYAVQSAYVSRNMQFKLFFFSTLMGTLVSAVVGVVMAKNGYGVWALVVQQLVCIAINSVVLAVTIKWRPKPVFKKTTIKETYNFAGKVMASDLIGVTFNQLNAFIIGLFYSAEDLAYYSKGQNLPNVVTTVTSTSFMSVLFPAMASISHDRPKIKNLLSNSTKVLSFILFPILCGMLIVSNELVEILYTNKWSGVVVFLQIMCVSSIISIISEFDITVLKAIGRGGLILKLEFIKKPLYILVTFIALQFGVVWIAMSLIAVNLIAIVVNSFALKKEIKYSLLHKFLDCLPAIALSIVMIVCVSAVELLSIQNIYLNIILKIAVGFLVYLGLAGLFRNKQLKNIIEFIKNKFFKKKSKKRALFVCNSVYQVMTASAIASKGDMDCDVIISNRVLGLEKIVKKLQKQNGYFSNCNFIETKGFCEADQNIQKQMKKSLIKTLKESNCLQKYDVFYSAEWDGFIDVLYRRLRKKSAFLQLAWYETGAETYGVQGEYFRTPSAKERLDNLLKNRVSIYDEVDSIHVFDPNMLEWSFDRNVKIYKIEKPNEDTQKFLSQVFDYKNLVDDYNSSLNYLNETYFNK